MGARIYLADMEQRHLHTVSGTTARAPEPLAVGSSAAGRAYRDLSP